MMENSFRGIRITTLSHSTASRMVRKMIEKDVVTTVNRAVTVWFYTRKGN